VKAARAQLAPFRATLAQLRIASKKPGCYFKRDWAKFDSPAFPLLGSFKLAAKAFCMSARLNALDGKAEEAASDLEAAARMTRHLGNSFEILSQLVSLALGAIIDNYAWQIVLDRPDDASFIVAGRAIAVLGSPPSLLRRFGDQVATPSRLVRAYEAEFRDYIFAYDFALDYFGACSWQFQDMLPGFAKAISDDLLDYEASILALEVIRKRYAALLAGPELGPRAKSRQQEITTWFGDQKGGVYKEAREWDIDLTNNVEGSTTALARSRAILAGIAILRARASGGHFPETLPDLGELGIDPLTDNPWLYKREGAGFRLRSPATRHTEHWGDRPLVEIIFPRPAVAGK
ncbi:MAG: hypothetical protein HY248_01395, partial [Fimbriimonas ginsengisoli]|nr:hypothetical protein [Fimbriimonas ginsengisoli]